MNKLTVLISICLTVASALAAPKYQVTDLGQDYTPISFNESGQVVLIQHESGQEPPETLYLWDKGQISQIYPTNEWFGDININNSGTIAGLIHKPYEGTQNSFKKEWGNLDITPSVLFWDINDSGQIVKVSSHPTTNESQTHLINPDGSLSDCSNSVDTFTFGVAVNNLGQVTGAAGDDNNSSGFVWDPFSGKRYLSPLNGDIRALGFDINIHGQVVGYSATSMDPLWVENWDWNLVLWDENGTINDLGCKFHPHRTEPSLNDLGQIVGDFKLPGDSDFNPYFWDKESGFVAAQDLDLLEDGSSWTITSLETINNLGQIIGTANGHAVLLTPAPEPATLALLLVGMVFIRRRG